MGISDALTIEVKGIAMLVVIIAVFDIVLGTLKTIPGISSNMNTSIDTARTALRSPITWVTIIIIIVIVGWLMRYLKKVK